MPSRVERLRVGPYRLLRPLVAGSAGERWVAAHEEDHSLHVAHRFKDADRAKAEAIAEAARALADIAHPHLLPIEGVYHGVAGSAWAISPFNGTHDGLVTLRSLLRQKGGQMAPAEVERALLQVLQTISVAHAKGCHHGTMTVDEILVDRRGSLSVELYGLRRRITDMARRPASEIARDEVRSVVGIGYMLLTGLPSEEPRIEASRLAPRADRHWDEWVEEGLDPLGGFATADEALAWLPGLRREVEDREHPVQTVIRRVREALRSD